MDISVKQIVVGILAAFFGMSILFGSWYTVDQGERAVILRNGEFVKVSEPGLGWKMPIIDNVAKMSVQSRLANYADMSTYSRDQQPAVMSVSVNYRINAGSVAEIYASYGGEEAMRDRLITPRVLAEVKNVFGRFNASEAIQQRERLNLEIVQSLQEVVQGAVLIESVQVENIDFSAAYEQSVEQRMLAEVDVQKIQQNLQRELVQAQIVTTQAGAEATRIREIGQAEADAINARGQALRDNPNLVALVQAERWNGILPTTMIPSGALPVIGMATSAP